MVKIAPMRAKVMRKLGLGPIIKVGFRATANVLDRYDYEYYAPVWAVLLLEGVPEYMSLSGRQLKALRRSVDRTLFNDDMKVVVVTQEVLEQGPLKEKCLRYLDEMPS
ncbi:MAG: hypothetical protein A2Z21_02030 [Candidatus Fraserbacteria bacterium RBG_16_55_9]|uniref:Uncharacterized protein n=1 Tax=Fraserbacteria sp. (strain RBG_16_55_9) TaxID=1817864 RepID=A0A1F5UP64_FRAXR|nr:MAG: hypothetical protein A2Z21_02030 [Candidatus Fraserbacteria bacterium RBG_16_55_9]